MEQTESKETRPEHIDEKGTAPNLDNVKVLNDEAAQATATEHSMTFMQGIKTHKKAAIWSVRECNLRSCIGKYLFAAADKPRSHSHLGDDHHGGLRYTIAGQLLGLPVIP